MPEPYFQKFAQRRPPRFPAMSQRRTLAWHFMAGLTIGVGGWYLQWRWLQSLNPDALFFSVAVVSAETLLFLGTLLFYFDLGRTGHPAKTAAAHTGRRASGRVGPYRR